MRPGRGLVGVQGGVSVRARGRQLPQMPVRQHADDKEHIQRRASMKRAIRQSVLYDNPNPSRGNYAGAQPYTDDKVRNYKPTRKPRVR